MNTKKTYIQPELDIIVIDSAITLQFASDPDIPMFGPGEVYNQQKNDNPFDNGLA